VEDADAGVEAAISAGMRVLGIVEAKGNKKATINAVDLSEISLENLLEI
jgi:beta-phosphoglucomutase-like phosphatase (HAD superfamily)